MQGDLISRSELLNAYKNMGISMNPDVFEKDVEELIKNQPTAYSIEKVIKQTHKIFLDELDIVLEPIPEGEEYTEEAYRIIYLNSKVNDVIRNGGKE